MIFNMKTKISLMLLAMGLASASAYAGTIDTAPMPVSNDINVTAPDQSGMWSFGATAVLLQPVSNDFTYINTSTDTADNYHSVDQSYHWWFGADVTYAFPGNGRDVTLAYEGLHGSDSDSAVGSYLGNTGTVTNPTFVDLPLGAEGKTDTSYDAGDLTFGQKLDVGQRIRLHPFMGVRYAHIDVKNTAEYTPYDANNSALGLVSGTQEGTFSGIGPRFGSDAQINLGQGFSVRGRLGFSALIGSSDPSLDYTTTDYAANTAAPYSVNHDSTTRVVPEMDGRLGLNYTYDFNSNMALGLEAGWQAVNYFNAVAQTSTDDGSVNHSDFALQGPYARLQLDVA
jgi:hypothetical protein